MLDKWAEQNPIEKAYLHTDCEDYIAGQTIWFKAYLATDFLPATRSSTLYVELLKDEKVMMRQVLPVVQGISRGQLELPDTLRAGQYMLRAYTPVMLNHDTGYLYKKPVFVFGKMAGVAPAAPATYIKLDFFPEGGNLISGLLNSVAFKATDQYGLPVAASGSVHKKSNGQKVAGFSAYHDGMGLFDMQAEQGEKYYAILDEAPAVQHLLPEPTPRGLVFRVIHTPQGKQYEIVQRPGDPAYKAAYMIGQMQHHVVFSKPFTGDKNEITGLIETKGLLSGILHITVFNKDGLPLAERLTFIDNKEYLLNGELVTDTLSIANRGRNRFSLLLPDTVVGTFSVSITDAAYDREGYRQQNILSSLLLTDDLKGYIHNPAYYFSASTDSVQTALDLLMMTHGWRRFKWSDAAAGTLPLARYKDPGYIKLKGQVRLDGNKKPFADKELLMYIVAADSSRNMQLVHTDADGRFSVDSLIFFEQAHILFSDIKGRKSKFLDVKMDADSIRRSYALPAPGSFPVWEESRKDRAKQMYDQYEAILKAEGLMMKGVTVRAKKKSYIEEIEEKYVSGLFSGDSRQTIDLLGQDLTPYANIFDYLSLRVPGVQIERDGMDYFIYYRQTSSISSMGNIPMQLFLDEIQTDASMIAGIPANKVALVKVFSNFVGASGAGAAMAIYLKKGADAYDISSSAGDIIRYNGYSVIKEFYSPDYALKRPDDDKADQRRTLFWEPALFATGTRSGLPFIFYNNDRTRKFRVVIEGMSSDGKMLMIEKVISPGGKAF